MTRLFNDMDAAHKRMLRNPIAFTDAIADAIGKTERGAHRQRHLGLAMCAGIARAVRKDFPLFEELRSAPCLQGNKKVQAATEKNFKKHVSFAVAARSFQNTEATENRICVYGYVTCYFAKKDIPVPRIADKIKAMKGIDGVYAKMKAKNREAEEPESETNFDGSGNTKSRSSKLDKREPAAPKSSKTSSDRESGARKSSKPSGEPLTVKWILENHLLVKMTPEELERYRDGSARRGQRRQLDTVYGGTDANKLHVWEYVYSRDIGADLSSQEDNDNDVDYEDEDAA